MVLKRKLSKEEEKVLEKVIEFVEEKHHRAEGHDYSHVLEVCKHSIEIARKIKEPVDPFVLLAGALLHDIGRVGAKSGMFHGIDGAARAEEFLESLIKNTATIHRITRIIVRHTPTSHIPPKSTEEKVVSDADTIERLGFMGMIRGIMGKKGTMEFIIEDRVHKRLGDYDRLFFSVSKKMAFPHYKETMNMSNTLKRKLKERLGEIKEIESYKLIKEEGS
ncbi:HD domain-containing protein [Candidatus Woesearchaeota archaeon]|nr:HD domain-containing protein [Candidatus Woesearchaeota archaeon]